MEPHIKEKIIDYLPKALLSDPELLENAIKMVQQRLKKDNAIRNLPQIENERHKAVRRVEEITSMIDGWKVLDAPKVSIKLKLQRWKFTAYQQLGHLLVRKNKKWHKNLFFTQLPKTGRLLLRCH